MDEMRNAKKKKTQHIEIFPPSAPFIDEMATKSVADESLSEDDCGQEELSRLSRIKKNITSDKETITSSQQGPGGDLKNDEAQPETEGNKPYQKRARKKTSKVWQYMDEVKVGTKEISRCKLCGKDFVKSDTASTSAMKRHLEKCVKEHGGTLQTQLQFQRGSNDEVKIASFKYDHNLMREKVSHYIMINELPFMHVESFMWNEIMRTATPLYQKITRGTLKGDCNTTYEIEKKKLKEKFKSVQKINITTDMWTSSCQKLGYMVITGHWIDVDWKLNSRVLNFCNVPPPHSGYVIADSLYKSLVDWGIEDKIGTITVDNAKANDVAVRTLKDSFSIRNSKSLPVGGKLFHVRCCAHILNLCVQDGLKPVNRIISRIRDGVKYVSASEGRLIKFAEIARSLQLKSKKLILDVSTRWNYTYYMLDSALKFKDVFPRFAVWDRAFSEYVPNDEDWEKVRQVCSLLHIFDGATKIVSGSQYPTSNLFLSEIRMVKQLIDKKVVDSNLYMREMANAMKEKFDKYWGESNLMMSIGAVMDPRFKLKLLSYCFPVIYPLEGESERNLAYLNVVLHDLYQEYVVEDSKIKGLTLESSQISSSDKNRCADEETPVGMSEYEAFIRESGAAFEPTKSELDDYLSESIFISNESSTKTFDALSWWKGNSAKYPILSRMARDILAVPLSTVASEATFSAGGRVIEPHRSCLRTETVEMLLCGADWAREIYGLKKSSQKKELKPVEIPLPG